MGAAYENTLLLRTAHCDLTGHLTMSQLALLLQEIAGDDCTRLGMGRVFLSEQSIVWVLSRMSVKVIRLPKIDDTICISTWHEPEIRYVFPRNFTVDDAQGNRLIEVSSLWVMIDMKEREIVFPSMRGIAMPTPPKDMPKISQPGKINFTYPLDKVWGHDLVYSDFDANGHVNNARYPLWITDLFAPQRYYDQMIDALQINFIKETLMGQKIILHYAESGNGFTVRGEVEGIPHFEAVGSFAMRANEHA